MSKATPIEDYKLISRHSYVDISFDNGLDRTVSVTTNRNMVFFVVNDSDDEDDLVRISTALEPEQAEAYATLLLYAAKLAREDN